MTWLIALCVAVFAALATYVISGGGAAIDATLLTLFRNPADLASPIGGPHIAALMRDITALGSAGILTSLVTLVGLWLLMTRQTALAIWLIGTALSSTVFFKLLKNIFTRARPDVVPHLSFEDSFSFPSGHTTSATVIYLTLAFIIAHHTATKTRRTYIIATAILIAVAVGLSRIYLGVHWPTDIAAGWALGSTWALACAAIARSRMSASRNANTL